MNTFVKINSINYPAEIYGHVRDRDWDNRESKVIVLALTIQEALALFTDNVQWSIVYGTQTIPQDDFIIAGPITDNRNGTVSVRMGKPTALEAKNAAEQKTQKVSMDLVTLAGKSLSGESNEISELRKSFEAACSKLADSDILIAPSLAPSWDIGQNIAQGERRYYRPNDTLHKALKPHTASVENGPGNTEYWEEV